MASSTSAKKDPILLDPLPNPGESLERQRDDILYERMMPWLVVMVMVVAFVIHEWIAYLFHSPRSPVLSLIVAATVIAIGIWKITKAIADLRNVKLGLRGEKAVGQFIEVVRAAGYFVLHDLIDRRSDGSEYNVDHVLIGPGGIFVLETKTRSKPARGDAIVRYDGDRVSVDGGPWDEEPVRQVKAAVSTVRRILEETTGRADIPIRPVLLFPGWFIEGTSSGKLVWVLEPKALPKWLPYEPTKLSLEDAALFHHRLSSHIRQNRKQK
ncbi:MAG: nuclease-related domain-containing protein [Phycisphaeraceae bacterium]